MKNLLSIIILLFLGFGFSQQKMIVPEYEPGQLIVKLKDDVSAGITYGDNNNTKSGIAKNEMTEDIGKILGISQKIKKQEVLFSLKSVERSIVVRNDNIRKQDELNNKPKTQGVQGSDPSEDNQQFFSMKNVIKIEFEDPTTNIYEIIEKLKDNPKVDYVEPNYIFSINDYTIESDIIYDKDLKSSSSSNTTTTTPSDPLYSEQSGIVKTNIDDVWTDYGTGDGSQIVAVLDTGVDYTHPDLEANIWVNEAELNGVEGYDDDGNGYVDDIRGWDFINEDNAPLDDNMHGTHVAGIIGAVGNNEKGIAGAAWNVKIMPIKVFQSSGRGNATDIALGVDYARIAGATIQNYSFGGFSESLTAKTAYENAYGNNAALLVGASGNNGLCIGPGQCPDKRIGKPYYPGAYTFILGVEDGESNYDNYDKDGPIFSGYNEYLNYELKAVGTSVMSTVPNGGYRKLSGTSMAAPLVAGAMALYLEEKPDDSKELIFGNLINTSGSLVDFAAALNVTPTPLLQVLGAEVKDEIDSQNNNGYWEPGETLEIFPTIKNYWGPTDDVRVGIEFAEFEDQTKAELVETEIAIGSITAYADLKITEKSLKIKLADGIKNDVDIKFKLSVWSGDDKEYLTSTMFTITVTNAIILDGYVESDLVLLEDNKYIFAQNLVVTNSSTLTIEPGVIIEMADNKRIIIDDDSKIVANGTKEKFIEIRPSNNMWGDIATGKQTDENEYSILSYVKILMSNGGINPARYYSGNRWADLRLNDVLIFDSNISPWSTTLFSSSIATGVNIIESYVEAPFYRPASDGGYFNQQSKGYLLANITTRDLWIDWFQTTGSDYGYMEVHENDLNPVETTVLNVSDQFKTKKNRQKVLNAKNQIGSWDFPDIYYGTGSIDILKNITRDFYNSERLGRLNYDSAIKVPFESAHGHVWKVLVNGKDAQDEYDEMDPIGVGEHEFKVYFNREMDTLVKPQISYGVRIPYNQKIISETGSWSSDGKIYTVTHDVNIGAADGINRIRVQDAKDLDNFVIPVEDFRFNMLIQSAGSASTGFAATPGLGEITLEWDAPREEDLADVLGYNMYRYELKEDDTYSDTLKINKNLITDLKYEDFDVVRNKKYYYSYKILRTSFEETDYSTTVTTELLTADLGDSNGDSSVNVLDVVNTVDYILGNNPTPFIDYATDVNDDSNINVLDVVGIVDLVLKGDSARPGNGSGFRTSSSKGVDYYPNSPVGKAVFYWEGNDLYVESEYNIGGMQLVFDKDFKYILSDELSKFEHIGFDQDNQKVFMFYSFNGVETQKKTKLLTRLNEDVSLDIDKAVVGTPNGLKLEASFEERILPDLDAPEQGDQLEILSVSPNPSNGKIKVRYYLPEKMDKMVVRLYNTIGQLIWTSDDLNNNPGQSEKDFDLNPVTKGIYIFSMDAFKSGEIKNRTYKRLVIE